VLAVTQDRIIGTENLQPQVEPEVVEVVLSEETFGKLIEGLVASQGPQAGPSAAGAARISQLEESLS
jgi:hypothetical protein